MCVFIPAECLSISVPSVGQSCSLSSDFVHPVGISCPVLMMDLCLWSWRHLSGPLKGIMYLKLTQTFLWIQVMRPWKERVHVLTIFLLTVAWCYPKCGGCLGINWKCKLSLSSGQTCVSNIPVTVRPALQKTWNSLRLDKEVHFSLKDSTLPAVPSGSPDKKDTIRGK